MRRVDFEEQIRSAHDDADALLLLCDELAARKEPWASILRLRAIQRRVQLRNGAGKSDDARPPEHRWLAPLDIKAPDGRSLYQYRLTTEQYKWAQEELARRAFGMRLHRQKRDCALFVLWAAEWFRRCYRGGIQRWNDLGSQVGLKFDQSAWRRLADEGLEYWRIPQLRLNGIHHRLSAIARQGGFPVAALRNDNVGWAQKYLERLTAMLLADTAPDLGRADAFALAIEDIVPPVWRHDGMRTVCAELALQIVRFRREAEAGGAFSGMLVSAWLDINRPDWRDGLPITIGEDDALVDGMMRAVPLRGGQGSIRAARLLVNTVGKSWPRKSGPGDKCDATPTPNSVPLHGGLNE
jgi:hypothetical protein